MKKLNEEQIIKSSTLVSRDLSWMNFNYRVLDQVNRKDLNVLDKLKFLAISASNLDEFFTIRVGSLYNYLDYGKERIDYSGLRELPFKDLLFKRIHKFTEIQNHFFEKDIKPLFRKNGFQIKEIEELTLNEKKEVSDYFNKIVFPMLTPMAYDTYHVFPILHPKTIIIGVTTSSVDNKKKSNRLSFVQIPQNLPTLYKLKRGKLVIFVSIIEIIKWKINDLYKNVEIISKTAFRITRNGDFTLEESDDIEADFVKEMQRKLKTRRTGRVVRIEIEKTHSRWLLNVLKERWNIGNENVFPISSFMDFSRFWEIIKTPELNHLIKKTPASVPPISHPTYHNEESMFDVLKEKDILLHHPYNSIEPLLHLLEEAAEDPNVLAIKQTIYRLAPESRVTNALLKAAESGKNVSVLIELKARFDEENNIKEAKKLEKAGCFVAYGIGSEKTHTKLMMIVRKENDRIVQYTHLGSGNYNETTSKLYTDISLLTSNESYGKDVSEFFNAITGYSNPTDYQNLITAPKHLRNKLVQFIENEISNAKNGKKSRIVIKINSLEDLIIINKLYEASQAGVKIDLIVRGICCLRPNRPNLSENITIRSIVGDYLEHSRIFYFQNDEQPIVLVGSADCMVRSFDRRVESLFKINSELLKNQLINILSYNLLDNFNSYIMNEDSSYVKIESTEPIFNVHEKFYLVESTNLITSI